MPFRFARFGAKHPLSTAHFCWGVKWEMEAAESDSRSRDTDTSEKEKGQNVRKSILTATISWYTRRQKEYTLIDNQQVHRIPYK